MSQLMGRQLYHCLYCAMDVVKMTLIDKRYKVDHVGLKLSFQQLFLRKKSIATKIT